MTINLSIPTRNIVVEPGIHGVFCAAMDRHPGDFQPLPKENTINLGAGNKGIHGATPLDFERGWMADQPMPFPDASKDGAYAFHFFEHLRKEEIIYTLHELERVLKPGSLVDIMVPYYRSSMAFQDLDHKSFWNEGTLPNLFSCTYYEGTGGFRIWKFQILTQIIMGIVERNLGLFIQLRRTA